MSDKEIKQLLADTRFDIGLCERTTLENTEKLVEVVETLSSSLNLAIKASEEMITTFKKMQDATTDIKLLPQQALNGCHGLATRMILKHESTLLEIRRTNT